jgi:Flp pilus assembly pilin Flp
MHEAVLVRVTALRNWLRLVPVRDDSGQGLAEYGLILLGASIVCIGAVALIGRSIQPFLSNVGSSI